MRWRGVGGYLDAFTAEDHTCYYAKAEAARLGQLGDVLADLYTQSRLPAVEVERERGVIREEIQMYQDQPAQVAEELLAAAVFPRHALGRPLAGTLPSVSAMKRDDLMGFWQTGYGARSTVLAVAGRVTHADVLAQVASLLAEMPAGKTPRFARWQPADGGKACVVIDRRETEQTQVVLGFLGAGAARSPAVRGAADEHAAG